MKKVYIVIFVSCLSGILNAQNPEYRVEKIVQTELFREPPRIRESKFEYTNDKLASVITIEDGEDFEARTYTYKKENISAYSKRMGMELNTFVFKNGLLQSYKSDKSNTFTYEYLGNQLSKLTHEDKCNQVTYSYGFKYDDQGKISAVDRFNKAAGVKPIGVYRFYYGTDGKLQRVDDGGVSGTYVVRSYAVEYIGNNVSKVTVSFQGKFEERYEFDYDENGNVVEEREFKTSQEKEVKARVVNISYTKAKGNDAVLWNVYDWIYNSMLGTRTYFELPNPCY